MTIAVRFFERLGLSPARDDAFLNRLETLRLASPRKRRGARPCPTAFGARRAAA